MGFLRQKSMHGYEIHQTLATAEGLGLVWRLKRSQLYALLSKLEDRGYITHTLEPQAPRPPRKVYRLTTRGQDALAEWLHTPVEHGRELRLEFLAKLYFAQQESTATVQTLLAQQLEMCRHWLATLEQEVQAQEEPRHYDWLVQQFRLGQVQAMLNWLKTCQNTLTDM